MKKKFIYPLFFQNRQGKEHVIAEIENMKEAFDAISKFCDERNFKIHYSRFWLEPYINDECPDAYKITFDVGSWSEFFNIYFYNENQANEFRNTLEN